MKAAILLTFLVINLQAQVNPAPRYLDKNQVKTIIWEVNDKFWNMYGDQNRSYEVPAGSGKHCMFANSIWIGGLDAGGQLRLAANTYKQMGTDFWPGPLDTTLYTA